MDNYIYTYYQSLKDGTTVSGRWIRLWYERIIHGLETGEYVYNAKAAKKALVFIEAFCRHHEGALAPQLLRLELWQKAFISVVFGIMDPETGGRYFREIVLVIARKNGKTLLAAAISCYCAFCDGEYGGRIYYAAPKLEQANLCFDATYQMIIKEPELSDLSKKRRSDIYLAESNTTLKPLAFNAKKSDGLNISLGVCDEIASWAGDQGLKFYEVLKSSMGARRAPLLLSISTAGYTDDGVYDELLRRSTSVLLGNSQEKRLAPFLYMIDDPNRWNDINELRKSNPNLGVSVSVDYLLEEIRIAEGSLSKKGEFLTKYCNIKQNSSCAWLRAADVEACTGEELRLEDFRRHYCVAGLDLSQTTDLSSACVVVEHRGQLYAFSHFWMPAARLEDAQAQDGVPYGIFIKQGLLSLSGENYIDYHDIYNWFVELMQKYEILPLQVGYDRYSAQYLIEDLKAAGLHCDDVYQGFNLSPVIRELEGTIKDGRLQIGNNNLLKSHLLNAATKADIETGKLKLIKTGTRTRIDGAAALLDAFTVRQKWYAEIGETLKNSRY